MIRYITLEEYFWLASQVTRQDVSSLLGSSDIGLAESAILAPAAGYSGKEFYPRLLDRQLSCYATSSGIIRW